MMKFFRALFGGSGKKEPVDITKRAKQVNAVIDASVNDVVKRYLPILLKEPITYIVFAVWGADKNGNITETQREIHQRIEPVVARAADILDLAELTPDRRYAVEFLVRGLIISKSTYMIELARSRIQKNREPEQTPEQSVETDLSTVEEWLDKLFNKDENNRGDETGDETGGVNGRRW